MSKDRLQIAVWAILTGLCLGVVALRCGDDRQMAGQLSACADRLEPVVANYLGTARRPDAVELKTRLDLALADRATPNPCPAAFARIGTLEVTPTRATWSVLGPGGETLRTTPRSP